MSNESIKPPLASINSLATAWNHINTKLRIWSHLLQKSLMENFIFSAVLKEEKVTFTQKQVVNINIVYEINLFLFSLGKNFALGNSSFWALKLTKNALTLGKRSINKSFFKSLIQCQG